MHAPVVCSYGSLSAALPLARPADTLVVAGSVLNDMQQSFGVISAGSKHQAACPLIEVAGSAAAIYQTGGTGWNTQEQEIAFEGKRKKLSLLVCNFDAILINIGRLLSGKTGDTRILWVLAVEFAALA